MNMRMLPEGVVQQELWVCKSALFASLCLSLKKLSYALFDPDEGMDGNEASALLRLELARLRYLPWQGASELFQQGDWANREKLSRQYGGEISGLIRQAEVLHKEWFSGCSILIESFRKQFLQAVAEFGMDRVKIACRSQDKHLFQQIMASELALVDDCFITGIEDYRQSPDFNVLFRIGSFRLEGIQKIAPAVLTAPKYQKLVRFCWDRTMDEEGVAEDPLEPEIDYLQLMSVTTGYLDDGSYLSEPVSTESLDEQLIHDAVDDAPVSCIRLDLSDGNSVLFRRGHHQLVCRIHDKQTSVFLIEARDIQVGDYWIDADVEVDLGKDEIDPNDFPMARIWKSALADLYRTPTQCIALMEQAGIQLRDPHGSVKNWCTFSRYRPNIPREKKVLRALIDKVLSPSIWDEYPPAFDTNLPVWELALAERKQYRSKRIGEGKISHEIKDEQLIVELEKLLSEQCVVECGATIDLPEDSGLAGSIAPRKILGIQKGFRAKATQLEKIIASEASEEYRTSQED